MLSCTCNLCYLIVHWGSKSRLVGWVLACNCFWLCWTLGGCRYAQYSDRGNGSHGYLIGAVGAMKSWGKPRERSHNSSLDWSAGLESVGYVPPVHVVQLLCPELYQGLHNDTTCFTGPTKPLISLWKQVAFLLQKVKSSKIFAIHSKALVHVQMSVYSCLYLTLILLACSQFVQKKKDSKVSNEWFGKPKWWLYLPQT